MPKFNISVPHTLEHNEAIERLRHFSDVIKESYGERVSDLKETWRDDGLDFAFSAMGFWTTGEITVETHSVHVNGSLPVAAMFFKGRIETGIRERLEKLLR